MAAKIYPTLQPEDRDSLADLLSKLLQKTAGPVATDVATFDVLAVVGTGSYQPLSEDELVAHAATLQCPSTNSGNVHIRAVGGTNAFTLEPGSILNLTPIAGAGVDLATLEVDPGVGDTVEVIYTVNSGPTA